MVVAKHVALAGQRALPTPQTRQACVVKISLKMLDSPSLAPKIYTTPRRTPPPHAAEDPVAGFVRCAIKALVTAGLQSRGSRRHWYSRAYANEPDFPWVARTRPGEHGWVHWGVGPPGRGGRQDCSHLVHALAHAVQRALSNLRATTASHQPRVDSEIRVVNLLRLQFGAIRAFATVRMPESWLDHKSEPSRSTTRASQEALMGICSRDRPRNVTPTQRNLPIRTARAGIIL